MSSSLETRNGPEFEQKIGQLMDRLMPHSYLSGVPVFRADAAINLDSMANEIDFIGHVRKGRRHTILLIECKACPVTGPEDGRGNFARLTPSGPWLAHYRNGEKPIKKQLGAQRLALLTNLEPLEGEVGIHAVVVASNPDGLDQEPGTITTQELPSFTLSVVRADRFEKFLQTLLEEGTALRVQQSEILRRIRLGQAVPVLGHPEIYNAIEYALRCRAFIDSEIFRHLDLKPGRWAINGSAGMGKSVLLIYATMVLITDRFVDTLRDGSRFLQAFAEGAAKAGLTPLEKRRVWVISHTEKQRDMLERMFVRFTELFSELDSYNEYRRVKPEFHVFSDVSTIDCNVLLVDEAHDLGPDGEKRVCDWHSEESGRYLVIACDRHQKLRLARDSTRMIAGLDFSLCTRKLNRNYRNPFPAYAGTLGLLFRWFANDGPKILPKLKQLTGEFGFGEATEEQNGLLLLRSRNDAHPANNWSHMLSSFPSAQAAYQQLSEFPLRKEHVLWVRFSPEESDFNYECLQQWSYHSVYGSDAPDLLDKYVKGQEFSVVVIEGLPEAFSWMKAAGNRPRDLGQARVDMWQARRMAYLAASRATVFLYFILPSNTPNDVVEEFSSMFRQLACKSPQESPSGTQWELRILETKEAESFDSYVDAIEAEPLVPSSPAPAPAISDPPIESIGTLGEGSSSPQIAEASPVRKSDPGSEENPLAPVLPKKNSGSSRKAIEALGSAATVEAVANALNRDVAALVRKLAAKGFPNLGPQSKVSVRFVLEMEGGSEEKPQIHIPLPTASAPIVSHKGNLPKAVSAPGPVGSPTVLPPTNGDSGQPPQPGLSYSLSDLTAQMGLPEPLITRFLEADGLPLTATLSGRVEGAAVDKLVRKLAGDGGIAAMKRASTTRTTVKSLANHLGMRPHAVVRDLMNDRLLLTVDDTIPYEKVVRLCHFHNKTIPGTAGALSAKS